MIRKNMAGCRNHLIDRHQNRQYYYDMMKSYEKTETGVKAAINSLQVEIRFFSASTIRILKYPEGKEPDKKSLSVINPPQAAAFSVTQENEKLTLKSEELLAVLNLKNGRISFESLNGFRLLSEKVSGTKFTDFDDAGEKTYSSLLSWKKTNISTAWGFCRTVKCPGTVSRSAWCRPIHSFLFLSFN